MGRSRYCAASVSVFLAMTSVAQATVGCAVTSGTAGTENANLHSDPDDASRIIREIPPGDIVQYPQQDLAPAQADGWVWVQHDITQEALWQSGIYGWLKVGNISDCG